MQIVYTYLTALVSFLIIDGVWLGLIARNFYANQIGFLMKENPNWYAAGIFYLIFLVGLVHFVILPNLSSENLIKTALIGGFFGFVCYATYDLTNLAVIKNWPLTMTVIDMIWGFVLSALVSTITVYFAQKFGY